MKFACRVVGRESVAVAILLLAACASRASLGVPPENEDGGSDDAHSSEGDASATTNDGSSLRDAQVIDAQLQVDVAPVQTDGALTDTRTALDALTANDAMGHTPTDVATLDARTEPPSYLTDEDFETGDLTKFPYRVSHTGSATDWNVVRDATCGGAHCAKAGVTPSNTSTSMELSLFVREASRISFRVRTNLEDAHHYFRFYVDGEERIELTGATAWTTVTTPIAASAPGGADHVLKWEMSRDGFVAADGPPRVDVYIDDIDMPVWNSEPSVPTRLRPGSGVAARAPTLSWISADPDFDRLTYEVQLSTVPNFSAMRSTGELGAPMYSLTTSGISFWRVRAKDNSSYRWSAWSEIQSIRVIEGDSPRFWQQTRSELELSTQKHMRGGTTPREYHVTRGLPGVFEVFEPIPGSTIEVGVYGPPRRSGQTFDAKMDGVVVASTDTDASACGSFSSNWRTIATCNATDCFATMADGQVIVTASERAHGTASSLCPTTGGTSSSWLRYPAYGEIVSPEIHLSDLVSEPSQHWSHVRVSLTTPLRGDVRFVVEDVDGNEVTHREVFSAAAGAARSYSLHLFDPRATNLETIRIRAWIPPDATLESWSAHAGPSFHWDFVNGDTTRFSGTAASGALRPLGVNGTFTEYRFASPVSAERFTRLVVRVRSSNQWSNDNASVSWSNNFGTFDVRRTYTVRDQYLYLPRDVTFDLTAAATPPNEPWQGMIEAIRISPVERYTNAMGMPASGWFEIESIDLY